MFPLSLNATSSLKVPHTYLVFNTFFHTLKKKIVKLSEQLKNVKWKVIMEIKLYINYAIIFKRFYLFILKKGEGGRKRWRETSICGCTCVATTGDLVPNQACALTGNPTSDPSVHKPALNPLCHTRANHTIIFKKSTSGLLWELGTELTGIWKVYVL